MYTKYYYYMLGHLLINEQQNDFHVLEMMRQELHVLFLVLTCFKCTVQCI